MSEQMRCVYCGNVLYSRPYSCCGEVNHCEPVDDQAEPQPESGAAEQPQEAAA